MTPVLERDASVLLRLGTATIYEASKVDCYLPARIRPAWPGASLVGRALPVRTAPADNLPIHLALERARPGDVLVVDGRNEDCGYWGDVLAVSAQALGVTGLVIDGGVRDTHSLEEMRFPVFSSHVAIRGTVKRDPGTVGEPIELDGTPVRDRDVVVADRDGIVVIAAEHYQDVLEASLAREAAESGYKDRLRAGELTLDVLGVRPA